MAPSKMQDGEGLKMKKPRHSFPVHFARYEVLHVYLMIITLVVLGEMTMAKEYYANSVSRSCVCGDDYDPNVDYFANKVEPTTSTGWSVEYHNNYKVVTDSSGVTAYLYLCGTPAPDVETDANTFLVSIPIQRASSASTTNFAYFEYLNQRDSLVFYQYVFGYVTDACMIKRFEDGDLLDTSNGNDAASANVDTRFVSYAPTDATIPYIVDSASYEDGPVSTAEWVKFFSLFFNREEAANDIFTRIKDRYECTSEEAAAAPSEPTLAAFQIPFLSATSSIYYETANAACSDFDENTIIANWGIRDQASADFQLMEDAGATVVGYLEALTAANGGNDANITFGQLLDTIADVDVILWESTFDSIKDTCMDRLLEFLNQTKAGRNGEVYDYGALVSSDGGTSWFESKSAQPDVALRDLVSILYPGLLPNYERVLLRKAIAPNVEEEIVADASQCEDVNTPLYSDWVETACNDDSDNVEIVGVEAVSADDICDAAPSTASVRGSPAGLLVAVAAFFGAARAL